MVDLSGVTTVHVSVHLSAKLPWQLKNLLDALLITSCYIPWTNRLDIFRPESYFGAPTALFCGWNPYSIQAVVLRERSPIVFQYFPSVHFDLFHGHMHPTYRSLDSFRVYMPKLLGFGGWGRWGEGQSKTSGLTAAFLSQVGATCLQRSNSPGRRYAKMWLLLSI